MSGIGKEKRPIELRADRLRREARERKLGKHEMTKDEEVDLLGRIFAEPIGHDMNFLGIPPTSAGESETTKRAEPEAGSEGKVSNSPPLTNEEVSGWGKVTGHGC